MQKHTVQFWRPMVYICLYVRVSVRVDSQTLAKTLRTGMNVAL